MMQPNQLIKIDNVGFLQYGFESTMHELTDCIVLKNIWVKHSHRNQGYARELMEQFMNRIYECTWCDKYDTVYLHAFAYEANDFTEQQETSTLIEFYKKFGFVVCEDKSYKNISKDVYMKYIK